MGFKSLEEGRQERYDEDCQRKLDREKMAPLKDNQLSIDLAADPKVRWAEEALELKAKLDRANHERQVLQRSSASVPGWACWNFRTLACTWAHSAP